MSRSPRSLSTQALSVLEVLGGAPDSWLYGLEVAAATGLKSGSLYPILLRLAGHGLLESRWLEPSRVGRPPRHAYRLSAAGRAALLEASLKGPSFPSKEAFA